MPAPSTTMPVLGSWPATNNAAHTNVKPLLPRTIFGERSPITRARLIVRYHHPAVRQQCGPSLAQYQYQPSTIILAAWCWSATNTAAHTNAEPYRGTLSPRTVLTWNIALSALVTARTLPIPERQINSPLLSPCRTLTTPVITSTVPIPTFNNNISAWCWSATNTAAHTNAEPCRAHCRRVP